MRSGARPAISSVEKRSQRRSRFGCRNCKLRKLKCDETRPQCRKCSVYGVVCNFTFNVADFQPLSEGQSGLPSPRPAISNAVWAHDESTTFTLDLQDQELFNRFRYRTVYTLGGSAMVGIYENHMLEVSFRCPFLLHAALAVTAVHDRYLGMEASNDHFLRESYHLSRCTSLFNKWLRLPLLEEHKDPLWATAGSLAILTFSSIIASSSEDAWPLKESGSSDLEWLRLGAGKMMLWHVVDPLRPGSVFRSMSEFSQMHRHVPKKGIDGIPAGLVKLCGLDESSTGENNPYFAVAHSLSKLFGMPQDQLLDSRVMAVLGHMHKEFGVYLERKDPIALLLLGLWYKRARGTKWWIDVRARYELPAIDTYLRRYHGGDSAIQAFIPWDEAVCSE